MLVPDDFLTSNGFRPTLTNRPLHALDCQRRRPRPRRLSRNLVERSLTSPCPRTGWRKPRSGAAGRICDAGNRGTDRLASTADRQASLGRPAPHLSRRSPFGLAPDLSSDKETRRSGPARHRGCQRRCRRTWQSPPPWSVTRCAIGASLAVTAARLSAVWPRISVSVRCCLSCARSFRCADDPAHRRRPRRRPRPGRALAPLCCGCVRPSASRRRILFLVSPAIQRQIDSGAEISSTSRR